MKIVGVGELLPRSYSCNNAPEGPVQGRKTWPRMTVDVDGELLAERELHDGLVLSAPEEGGGAPQG